MTKQKDKERAIDEVFESIKVIDSSLRCYYMGEEHMYRAMAAQLRILFCDTRRGQENSLLGRAFTTFELPRLVPIAWLKPGSADQRHPRVRRLRAAVPPGWQARFAKMPFVVVEYKRGLVVADIEVEDEGPLLPIDKWSAQLITTHPSRVSIRNVIRTVADKGGGAHVDLDGSAQLTAMSRARPAGVAQHVLFTVAIARFVVDLGVHLAQLREKGGFDGSLPDFEVDSTHESAARRAQVPDETRAGGSSEYHLISVRVEKEPAEPEGSPSARHSQ